MICIGIDPGVHTGLALWDSGEKRLNHVYTMRIDEALGYVMDCYYRYQYKQPFPQSKLLVVFEDARQRKWIPAEKDLSTFKGRALGAGSVRRDCQIWEDFLKAHGIRYEAVPPHKGMTKWSADAFARVTGFLGRTSNHGRDAAMLVFGRY